jgi:DNA-binding response OmpR family regulator
VSSAEAAILVVDDNDDNRYTLTRRLRRQGYDDLTEAASGREALEQVGRRPFDLVLLDVMMPEMNGFEALEELRRVSSVPVIMLTVKGEESDKVRGLSLGADDYVTKPFSQRELLSRIQAVLRRAETPAFQPRTKIVVDDDLTIDFSRNEVWLKGKKVQLTPTEYRLLYHLVSNPGRILSHESLLAKVWGYEYREEEHYVRLYITYLRQKIEPDPAHPKYILTERGLGYRFVDYRDKK